MTHPSEASYVEQPFIAQLQMLGWRFLAGDVFVPAMTERETFRDVLLHGRLRAAIRRINTDAQGNPWLDEHRINQTVAALERLGALSLIEANQRSFDLLIRGTPVDGDPARHGGKQQTVQFIDFEHPERNDYLVVNQFRVDRTGGQGYDIPDLVLFVNGIPLVVVECKNPVVANPIEAALDQLLRYSNQREWTEQNEGIERLFHYNQLMIATSRVRAVVGTVSAKADQYYAWKDTSPVPMSQVAQDLGVEQLNSQHILIAGMLRPTHLLDIIQNFMVFTSSGGQTRKIAPRYQQFRAVQLAVHRLLTGATLAEDGLQDRRGGIIWHTQGSGKSLTMVFLVRKMRSMPQLRQFKVVVVTDRTDLERQLSDTASLIGDVVSKAKDTNDLKSLLRSQGADVVFAMIQKYQARDRDLANELPASPPARAERKKVAEPPAGYATNVVAMPPRMSEPLGLLNTSSAIVVLIDEAHRSQASGLHANLLQALPNCARIGFTGTPIFAADRKRTEEIFGPFIDRYTIQQSEQDGATVPILYEGREVRGIVANSATLDELFDEAFKHKTPEEREKIKQRYATMPNLLESVDLIQAKARDMFRHYVSAILPDGFKAQVVGNSRLAAVRYQAALMQTKVEVLAALNALDPAMLSLPPDELSRQDGETQFLVGASRYRDVIERLEATAVISSSHNDDSRYTAWSNPAQQETHIKRFQKPLIAADLAKQDGLAFVCVRTMLLTGFDAPNEQVLYLDRPMAGHELLQAIARVNRTAPNKHYGRVVDYYGIGQQLVDALAIYTSDDTGAQEPIRPLRDELPTLQDRHQRVLALFHDNGVRDLHNLDACIYLFRNVQLRAELGVKLKQFLETLDLVLPHPAALPYVDDARLLGWINTVVSNHYRDQHLNLLGVGAKVRDLIDEHVLAHGIDPKVPPISILDARFEQAVEASGSTRTQASAMEHAVRHHIDVHYDEDPAYYKKLSEQLEELLAQFATNWDDQATALQAFINTVRVHEQHTAGNQADVERRFYGLLQEESGNYDQQRLSEVTLDLVEHLRQELRLVDFWRSQSAQDGLLGWIVELLDDHDVVPFQQQKALATRIIELAHQNHTRIVR